MEDSIQDMSCSNLEDSAADMTSLVLDESSLLEQSGSEDRSVKKGKGKARRTPNKRRQQFIKNLAAKQDKYKTMNSFLNSSVTKRSLRNNNRELARGLQLKKRELHTATQTLLDLQHENQSQRMRLAMLERLAGATNEQIEAEVARRIGDKLAQLRTSLTDVKFQMLDTVATVSQALEVCDTTSSRSSLSNSALSAQSSALATPEALPATSSNTVTTQPSSEVDSLARRVPVAMRTLSDVAQRLAPSVQEMSMIMEQSCLHDFDLPFTEDNEAEEGEEAILEETEKFKRPRSSNRPRSSSSSAKHKRSRSDHRRSALIFIPSAKDNSKDSPMTQDDTSEPNVKSPNSEKSRVKRSSSEESKVNASKPEESTINGSSPQEAEVMSSRREEDSNSKKRFRHRSTGTMETAKKETAKKSSRLRSRSVNVATSVGALATGSKTGSPDKDAGRSAEPPDFAPTRRVTRRASRALSVASLASDTDHTAQDENETTDNTASGEKATKKKKVPTATLR